MDSIASQFLGDALATFRRYRELGAGALDQLADADVARPLGEEDNSVAVIVKHLRGNMLSRWRDFLTTDGEKPDRDRDSEFELEGGVDAATVRAWWDEGWEQLFRSMEALRPTDLERTVTLGGQPLSVLQAITRQLTHAAYHVGQIVLIAKHYRGPRWRTLSIPKRRPGGGGEGTAEPGR